MNFRGSHKGRRRVETTLELTPLIDVIFLLLIFFVMTTTPAMSAVEKLDLTLPDAGSGQALDDVDQERLMLRVYPQGRVTLRVGDDGGEQEVDDIGADLAQAATDRPGATVWVQGDVDASHGAVVEILDAADQAGFERVHLAVRPAGSAGAPRD